MKQREFIAVFGGAAWYGARHACWTTGDACGGIYPSSAISAGFAQLVGAFRQGLSETGYVKGRNVTFQFRWAEGQSDRLDD